MAERGLHSGTDVGVQTGDGATQNAVVRVSEGRGRAAAQLRLVVSRLGKMKTDGGWVVVTVAGADGQRLGLVWVPWWCLWPRQWWFPMWWERW